MYNKFKSNQPDMMKVDDSLVTINDNQHFIEVQRAWVRTWSQWGVEGQLHSTLSWFLWFDKHVTSSMTAWRVHYTCQSALVSWVVWEQDPPNPPQWGVGREEGCHGSQPTSIHIHIHEVVMDVDVNGCGHGQCWKCCVMISNFYVAEHIYSHNKSN